ncbi:arsenic resistance N-acetyltransferase ArsN2, partial [Pseudomonas aeruginosa]|uniref:arsenic resistance N-acetyltransferase ArsN2 n=1 Tax=Pseudomonas aeruginosa TaxID=287 RepID=UPI002F91606E
IFGDAPDLRAALTAANLPVDDLTEPGRAFFRFADAGRIFGFGGFELYGENALLRSIVVLPEARGKGQGKAATDLLIQQTAAAGARTAYLLTTNAAPFFERNGFRPIDRSAAPADILTTRQAASLCPSTAA